jgi:hypothetical protein
MKTNKRKPSIAVTHDEIGGPLGSGCPKGGGPHRLCWREEPRPDVPLDLLVCLECGAEWTRRTAKAEGMREILARIEPVGWIVQSASDPVLALLKGRATVDRQGRSR